MVLLVILCWEMKKYYSSTPDEHEDYYVVDIDPDSNYFSKFDFNLAKGCHYYN